MQESLNVLVCPISWFAVIKERWQQGRRSGRLCTSLNSYRRASLWETSKEYFIPKVFLDLQWLDPRNHFTWVMPHSWESGAHRAREACDGRRQRKDISRECPRWDDVSCIHSTECLSQHLLPTDLLLLSDFYSCWDVEEWKNVLYHGKFVSGQKCNA